MMWALAWGKGRSSPLPSVAGGAAGQAQGKRKVSAQHRSPTKGMLPRQVEHSMSLGGDRVRGIAFLVALAVVGPLPACGGGEEASRTATPGPSSTTVSAVTATPSSTVTAGAAATATPPARACFDVGIYEHALCRLPNGTLALYSLGDLLATSEKAYPHCPDLWLANDAGRLCVPPGGWSYIAETPGAVTSAAGARVTIGDERAFGCPDTSGPVAVSELVLGPQPKMFWCLRIGQRWATISVPADAPMDEYYTAFQVALSGEPGAPTP